MIPDNNNFVEKFGITANISDFIKNNISISTRKKVMSYVRKFLFPATQDIPLEVLQEWEAYPNTRSNTSLDIIEFSMISWNFRFQRPQHLALQLAKKGHRIFYIEHEFISYLHPNRKIAPIQVKKMATNVYKIIISASRELFIYKDKTSKNDKKIIMASLKNLFDQAKIINPIAKIDHPFWSQILDELSMPIIYDCMDNHQGFHETNQKNSQQEIKLFQSANITLVSSKYLSKKANKFNAKNIVLLPNACDYKHFSKKQQIYPLDIKNLPKPIIGYYGAIGEWFDTKILEDIAKKNSSLSIVLIGQVLNKEVKILSQKYPNIHLLGEKPYSILPDYLHYFDVAMIPFKLNELIKATHPVKMFEYFAAKKPVVSTEIPEILEYSNIINFANQKNFSIQINKFLQGRNTSILEKELVIAKENQWQNRGDLLNKNIFEKLFPKVSVVILTYNGTKMSKDTIDSVLKRSFYPNLETIVVDNASEKETVLMLKKYKKNPNLKIILNRINFGFAKGNNIGTRLATGEYIILLNNDVLVTPGWVSRLIYHASKNNVGLVGPVTNSIGNEAKINISYDPENMIELENEATKYTNKHWGETQELNNLAAFCWICPKSVYNKIGELDERFGRGMFEDDDYCYRVKKAGYKIICADDVFIHHFGGASFKKIVSQEYLNLFESNKKKFEDKWNTKWIPHQYREELR